MAFRILSQRLLRYLLTRFCCHPERVLKVHDSASVLALDRLLQLPYRQLSGPVYRIVCERERMRAGGGTVKTLDAHTQFMKWRSARGATHRHQRLRTTQPCTAPVSEETTRPAAHAPQVPAVRQCRDPQPVNCSLTRTGGASTILTSRLVAWELDSEPSDSCGFVA